MTDSDRKAFIIGYRVRPNGPTHHKAYYAVHATHAKTKFRGEHPKHYIIMSCVEETRVRKGK